MNIDEMDAGRELDALVAEKVMGMARPEGKITWWGLPSTDGGYSNPPPYSTNIADAFPVAVKFGLSIVPYGKGDSIPRWHASDGKVVSYGATAPLAICRAALKINESTK